MARLRAINPRVQASKIALPRLWVAGSRRVVGGTLRD
jgi:hypothetical protein